MSKILIRVQSPDGTKRIELPKDDVLAHLYERVYREFKIDPTHFAEWSLFSDRNKSVHVPNSRNTRLHDVVSHGDILFLMPCGAPTQTQVDYSHIEEDQVDLDLAKQHGKISRERDEQLCHHGPQGKCIHCTEVEPFDTAYLASRNPPVKYMSFHAYIKKLQSGIDKGKYLNLENMNCKIRAGCKEHPAWPKGICNKCQPPTIYLNRQFYRHVDNIMFENSQIVDNFLNYWRKSGTQRIGLLYGRYEAYDGVPLGIKAVVSAIYEPPQVSTESSVELELPDPNEEKVNNLCKKLGLKCVGWMFTDLVTEDTRSGSIKHFRGNANSYYLTAEECIMAGYFQNKYKNYTKLSMDGYFGSKFVTVVVTGDSSNQIHFEAYQVSEQCAALVRDECMIPTIDAPELAYIRESSNEKYIPDVYFREKDQYNNEVTKIARPLPVEYLLVDLPAGFAKDPIFSFNDDNPVMKFNFPIENRTTVGEAQDFSSMQRYMNQFPSYKFLDAISNFHLLIFLITNQTVHFDNVIDDLLAAIKSKNAQKAIEWAKTPEWLTIEHFIVEGINASMGDEWSCAMCTFKNEPTANVCSICQTPRG